ncbi:MAG: SDR family NAD(P)-dependent oxidoreductase [Myxococcales bacterium]|nr:SDR family NAD(P)-dependent oxidoreductase [Myxococcales bacterium]
MNWTRAQIPDQSGRLAIVTGANSGIGFVTAEILASKGARVILACRNQARAEAAQSRILQNIPSAEIEIGILDLSSLASIEAFAKRTLDTESQVDLLINNAGIMMPPVRTETADGFEMQVGVNHLGHFSLTLQLLPLLNNAPAARVVTVSSLAHYKGRVNLGDLNYKHRRYWRIASYGQSKRANLLFSFELNRRLRAAGARTIATAAHPGWTSTGLQRHIPGARLFNALVAMQPAQGALPTLRAATDLAARGADYFGPKGLTGTRGYPVIVGCASAAKDPASAAKLWLLSEDLTGQRMTAIES